MKNTIQTIIVNRKKEVAFIMQETEKKYLKWYQKIAYGAGDLASNTSYGLVSSFVLLYLCTDRRITLSGAVVFNSGWNE